MSKWVKIAALFIAAVALVILAYAVLTPEAQTDETDHGGMWDNRMTYSSANVSLIAVSIAAIMISLMIILLWREYEPLPPSMALPPTARKMEPEPRAQEKTAATPEPQETPSPDEAAEKNYLILRLLTGDERIMFKAVMDSGGEALQKDLILRTKMSKPKVSRVLDKLAQKGVVTKERHGATNKIRIRHGD
jgi:uncharacterized membrane protein